VLEPRVDASLHVVSGVSITIGVEGSMSVEQTGDERDVDISSQMQVGKR